MKKSHIAILVASTLSLALLGQSTIAAEFEFKFQSSDPSGNPNFELQQGWTQSLAEITGGRVMVELLPVGSVVEHSETQDAIAAGILDGHITDTSYFTGKDAAFGLIANPVGAWSDPEQMFDFME
ncbi:MAG: C4-dicarboxylate ABC transporter substrate-binding protein, partial [Gammaproteobacteria bacterium]|nr:C4-dicarboxylate ABC transporter substrate-binding protein [Gammaproteobacteria bacterium]